MRRLLRPRLDFRPTLDQQFAELQPATFHLAQSSVQHLNLLSPLRQLETRLPERIPFHVTIRANLHDPRFHLLDFLPLLVGHRVRLRESRLCFFPTRMRFVPRVLQRAQIALHAAQSIACILGRPMRIALLGLRRCEGLRDRQDVRPPLLHRLLRCGETGVEPVNDSLLIVVRLLVVGERLGGFPQIDFALNNAVRRLFRAVITAVN